MARGKLCPMRGGRYFNLQSWENGRNVVRYVHESELQSIREAVKGYWKFMMLAHKYADLVIRDTRKMTKKALNAPRKGKNKEI